MSARALLRSATRPEHDRVDAAFSRHDLSTRDGYRSFLMQQASAHLPVEQALDAMRIERSIPDWPQRRRAALVRADLADLGCTDLDEMSFPGFNTAAAALGGAYVLEGSRLGGTVLRRQVGVGLPTRFLEPGPSDGWRHFLDCLEGALTSPEQAEQAVQGARAVFECFEAAAGREVEMC